MKLFINSPVGWLKLSDASVAVRRVDGQVVLDVMSAPTKATGDSATSARVVAFVARID